MPGEVPTLLDLQQVSLQYRGRSVLSAISFQVEAGSCLGITGANGSGKSSLLRLIAGAQRPDSGTVRFRGRDVGSDRQYARRSMGYVPQDNALSEECTVGQQLRLWQAARGVREPLPAELMDLLGLDALLSCRTRELSGGMGRRVCIAMALAAGGELLVMDEATVGLDAAYCEALLDWVEGFLQRGGTVIWCSHRPEELERLCNRCLCLRDGQAGWGL